MVNLDYLIVGTGRCGTGTINKTMSDNGIKCGHESIFGISKRQPNLTKHIIEDRCKNSKINAESSWLAVPFLSEPWLNPNTTLIHLVRNPIEVIKSFVELQQFTPQHFKISEYTRFMLKYNPYLSAQNNQYINGMYHYFHWNSMIKVQSNRFKNKIFIRLEDDWEYELKSINLKHYKKSITNTKSKNKKHKITKEQVHDNIKNHFFYDQFKKFAKQYKYEL